MHWSVYLTTVQGFATRGAGAITVEATAVVPEGRISPEGKATVSLSFLDLTNHRHGPLVG